MARPAPTLDQQCFTVDEYHRMAETEILAPDERVELIRGVIHKMSPKNRAHISPPPWFTTSCETL